MAKSLNRKQNYQLQKYKVYYTNLISFLQSIDQDVQELQKLKAPTGNLQN